MTILCHALVCSGLLVKQAPGEFPSGLAGKDRALWLWLEFDPWPQELPHAVGALRKKKEKVWNYKRSWLIQGPRVVSDWTGGRDEAAEVAEST